jgi:EmrB/QacA subfamily drug resistance transporter
MIRTFRAASPTESVPAPRPSALAMFGLLAGPLLSMIDSSVINVAVPDIARSLHTDLSTVQWTVSGYLLALAAMLAASAWLTRRFGSRRVYLVCMAAFTAASALCALAPNVQFLIAARGLQGLAGAPLTPIAMSMLLGGSDNATQGAQSRGAAAGVLLFLAPALGPTVGGFLIQAYGWPAIFLINLPFGVVGLLGAVRIPERFSIAPDTTARFDPTGLALLAIGCSLALYGAGQSARHGWLDPSVLPFWASGLLLVALYVLWAWRRPNPVLSLVALRDRRSAVTIGLATLVSIVSFSSIFLVPVVMQFIQGFSALQAGLAMLPGGLVMGLGAALGGYVTKSGRVRLSVMVGSVLLVLTTMAMLLIELRTPAWETALILCGRGLAFGLIVQPLLVAMMAGFSRADSADASTLFNVIQRLGGSFGIGLLATVFAERAATRAGDALRALAIRPSGSGGSGGALSGSLTGTLASAPAPVRSAVEAALASSFHDVVWVLVGVSSLGIALALLLPRSQDRAQQAVIASQSELAGG